MVKPIKPLFFLFCVTLIFSCARGYRTIDGGFWPKKPRFSLAKHKNKNVSGIVDTDAVYQLYAEFIGKPHFDSKEKEYYRLTENREGYNAKSFIRFYENGNMNLFHVQKDSVLQRKHFNPKRGWIGVYNIKNKEFKTEVFLSRFGSTTYLKRKGRVSGDTLHIIYNPYSPSPSEHDIYIKQNIPLEFLNWETNW